jgi:hypothetical protein
MQPGRELDALIAVEVMDWIRSNEFWYDEERIEETRFESPDGETEDTAYGWGDECNYEHLEHLPPYSTSIAAAWKVVEKLMKGKRNVGVWSEDGKWEATIEEYDGGLIEHTAVADTAPLAICLAALAVKENKEVG